jgi:hypothetical protein
MGLFVMNRGGHPRTLAVVSLPRDAAMQEQRQPRVLEAKGISLA